MREIKILEVKEKFDQGDQVTYHCVDLKGISFDVFIDHDEKIHIIKL